MTEENNTIFKETLKFKYKMIWGFRILALFIIIIAFAIPFYVQIIRGIKFGNHPASDSELIIICLVGTLIMVSVGLLIEFTKLTTEIDNKSIKCVFSPGRKLNISWDLIEKYYVMSSFQGHEFLGYGFRRKVYDIIGSDKCLLLKIKTGEKILIGTRKEKELIAFLNNIKSTVANMRS